MRKLWKIPKYEGYEKELVIEGPLELIIDYDDVNHDEVDKLLKQVVSTLNTYFPGVKERTKDES